MLYKVYVIYSPAFRKLFTGITTALGDRMFVHNGDQSGDWTNDFSPWTLIHLELFGDEEQALLRKSFLEDAEGRDFLKSEILPLFNF